MSYRYIICTRKIKKGKFIPEPGETTFLKVPTSESPMPSHKISSSDWFNTVQKASIWGEDSRDKTKKRGDILVFIHGYNNSLDQEVIARHDQLDQDLRSVGFKGIVVSYDWPSDNKAVAYLEDRHDAKKTAMQLVSDAISVLSARQTPDCRINIHILAHSTGALVVREAFDDADDSSLMNNAWMVSQVVFIGGDLSSNSLIESNAKSAALFRHCNRLTNYSNLYDSVLKLSNAKRIGLAPRVGRIGLPDLTPTKAINVDCSSYFEILDSDPEIKKRDQVNSIGAFDHSWYIGNRKFSVDLFETLIGDYDRSVIASRKKTAKENTFTLD